MEHCTYSWSSDDLDKATLENLDVVIKQGQLVAVFGTVGCGKSSFLAALLGEMNKRHGTVLMNVIICEPFQTRAV